MKDFPESEEHFGRVGVEFVGPVDFDLGDVGGGEGEGEVGGGEVAVGGHFLCFSFGSWGVCFVLGVFLDGGSCYVFFFWKGWVGKLMFVYSKGKVDYM